MAENESNTAVQETPYNIRIEDAGPATKKVHVEVPKEKVAEKIAEQYKELRHEAIIPGFRKGRAPQKLIEKKFSDDVREQVRRSLISESYEQAIEQNKLQVLGEPDFDNPDQIKLDDDGPMSYTFSVEIQPDIQLPDLKGLKVRKPKISVTEDHINQAMQNLREQQGALTPVEDRGVEEKDYVIGDVHARIDGNVVSNQPDAQIVVRPGRIAGLQIDDLPQQLAGARPGEKRTLKVTVPDNYPTESIRGKEVEIEIDVKDIKRLQPVDIDKEFLDSLGFQNEEELRQALREQMEERIDFDVKAAMRRQVTEQLNGQVNIELPTKLSLRQTDRVVNRRAVDLMMRGMSQEQVSANLDRLRAGAAEEGSRELKTFFILQKVAEQTGVDVSEAELNGRIAMIALQQGRRPEKLKQELSKDQNMLANLYVQMREEKAIDKVLEDAQIEEVEPTAEEQKSVTEPKAAEDESSAT
jgi:trigger factor